MEEEKKSRRQSVISTMRYLLLLLLTLAACSKAPPPDSLHTQVPATTTATTMTAVPATPLQQSPVPVSPTSLPSAEFQGISLDYDERLFGTLQETTRQPAAAGGKVPAQPEHIRFTFAGSDLFGDSQLLVYPVAHYIAISAEASSHIKQLNEILLDRPLQPQSPLPLFPLPHTVEMFHSSPDYVNFLNGNGVSFIAQVDHDSDKKFLYTFQGITDDGKYYATVMLPVNTDKLGIESGTGTDANLTHVASRQNILDLELENAQNRLNDSIHSLEILPQDGFPSPTPPAYISYPGVLLAYYPEISGEAAAMNTPPVFFSSGGSAVFLAGVPDAIQVTFNNSEQDRNAALLIQPVRGATKQFFPSIPPEQQQQIQELEAQIKADSDLYDSQDGSGFERLLPFQSGSGLRRIKQSDIEGSKEQPQPQSYQFQGMTEDGRYYIQFEHPIQLVGPLEEVLLNADSVNSADFLQLLTQLDQMIQTLIVAPDASTNSSIPVNPPDCTLDAQFVEDITIPDHSIIERGEIFTKTWRVRNTGTCTWTPAYQINLAGGNPLSWSRSSLVGIVPAGEEAEISIEIVSPEIPGNYQAWWQLANDMGEPFGAFYYLIFEAPPPATDIPGHGVIEGQLSYPAGGLPAMTIYFLRTDSSQRFALETEEGWDHYVNELPVGDYFVFARVTGDDSDSGGGYTAAAICGLTCENHTLVEVNIKEGKALHEINILDWYAPAGTFPLP
jgi:hypothetical protein